MKKMFKWEFRKYKNMFYVKNKLFCIYEFGIDYTKKKAIIDYKKFLKNNPLVIEFDVSPKQYTEILKYCAKWGVFGK